MYPNAQRSGGRTPGADAYWQRRFFTLVAGLGVVGLLAWACSGVASGGNSSPGSGRQSPAAGSTTTSTPSPSQAVTSAPASPSASASRVPSAVSPSRSASPSAPASASSQARPARAAHPAAAGPTACPASDLVLTLTASKASYGPQETPAFQVDIVSTDTATCTLDTGPAALRLEVLHGASVAYNSAACLHGAHRQVISLRRGVPVVTSMAWDKHETVAGCSGAVMAATNRTYSAVAQAGGAQSPRSSFRLTGAAASATRPAGQPSR